MDTRRGGSPASGRGRVGAGGAALLVNMPSPSTVLERASGQRAARCARLRAPVHLGVVDGRFARRPSGTRATRGCGTRFGRRRSSARVFPSPGKRWPPAGAGASHPMERRLTTRCVPGLDAMAPGPSPGRRSAPRHDRNAEPPGGFSPDFGVTKRTPGRRDIRPRRARGRGATPGQGRPRWFATRSPASPNRLGVCGRGAAGTDRPCRGRHRFRRRPGRRSRRRTHCPHPIRCRRASRTRCRRRSSEADHPRERSPGAGLTAAPGATFRGSRPRPRVASRTRAPRRRDT